MVEISNLQPTDRCAWQAMLREFVQHDWSAEQYDAAWPRLQAGDDIHALGARIDGQLVGFAHFFPHAHTNGPDVCYLHHLFTATPSRNRGVARSLITAVADWARHHECNRLYWVVHDDNLAARSLYDRVGRFEGFIEYRMPLDGPPPESPVGVPGPDIRVGALSSSDRDRWETLFRDYITFYERSLPDSEYDRAWGRVQDDDVIHALGAWTGGELIGIVHFLAHPHTNGADVCYLQDLFTAPDARGRGVGRALIGAVADWARHRGCSRVYWATQESNTTARRLYDQVAAHDGFIIYRMPL